MLSLYVAADQMLNQVWSMGFSGLGIFNSFLSNTIVKDSIQCQFYAIFTIVTEKDLSLWKGHQCQEYIEYSGFQHSRASSPLVFRNTEFFICLHSEVAFTNVLPLQLKYAD